MRPHRVVLSSLEYILTISTIFTITVRTDRLRLTTTQQHHSEKGKSFQSLGLNHLIYLLPTVNGVFLYILPWWHQTVQARVIISLLGLVIFLELKEYFLQVSLRIKNIENVKTNLFWIDNCKNVFSMLSFLGLNLRVTKCRLLLFYKRRSGF